MPLISPLMPVPQSKLTNSKCMYTHRLLYHVIKLTKTIDNETMHAVFYPDTLGLGGK